MESQLFLALADGLSKCKMAGNISKWNFCTMYRVKCS